MASARDLSGEWTYRSFHNNSSPVEGDPNKALALFFAEATFRLSVSQSGKLTGAIDWKGVGLVLTGSVSEANAIEMTGRGRVGSQTDGWRYDYDGILAHQWLTGVSQVPALVGSVIRAVAHDGAPAGYVATFIAVRKN